MSPTVRWRSTTATLIFSAASAATQSTTPARHRAAARRADMAPQEHKTLRPEAAANTARLPFAGMAPVVRRAAIIPDRPLPELDGELVLGAPGQQEWRRMRRGPTASRDRSNTRRCRMIDMHAGEEQGDFRFCFRTTTAGGAVDNDDALRRLWWRALNLSARPQRHARPDRPAWAPSTSSRVEPGASCRRLTPLLKSQPGFAADAFALLGHHGQTSIIWRVGCRRWANAGATKTTGPNNA